MVLLRELLRTVVFSPYVLLAIGAAAALFLFPSGNWMMTAEQRQGQVRQAAIENQLEQFNRESVSIEIGAAQGYAFGCDMSVDSQTLATVMGRFSLQPEAFVEGGIQRTSWEAGVERVANLLARDGGWEGNRSLTCSLAVGAYGRGGTIIPSLLSGSR